MKTAPQQSLQINEKQTKRYWNWGLLLLLPLFVIIVVFAFIPAVGMFISSIMDDGKLTFRFYSEALSGQFLRSFKTTALLSLYSTIISVIWGAIVTWCMVRIRVRWLQNLLTSLANSMAHFAGLPLAIAFMTAFGFSGIVNLFLGIFHANLVDMGFSIGSFVGLMIVYTSFLVPLSIILLLPAFMSIDDAWEEAALSLGAPMRTYVSRILVPILIPNFISTAALVFASAFSTYVTAYMITAGSVNLIPINIGNLINGDVNLDIGLGDALVVEEIIVLSAAVVLSQILQNTKTARVLRGDD